MSHLSGSLRNKKKNGFGLFGRKKSKNTPEQTPVGPGALEYISDEYETDSDDANGLAGMAPPGGHYTALTKSRSGTDDGSRGRGVRRGGSKRGDTSRSRSRSSSVSSAFRRLVRGRGNNKNCEEDERSQSRRGRRKSEAKTDEIAGQAPPIPKTIEAPQSASDKLSETPKVGNRKQKQKDDPNLDGSLTGIEEDERSRSYRGRRKSEAKTDDIVGQAPPIPRTIEAPQSASDKLSETPKVGNRKQKQMEDPNLDGSLTGIEISLKDDASTGRNAKKKKKTKRKKEKGSINDDDTMSKSPLPPLDKKKCSRKKLLGGSTLADGIRPLAKKKSKKKRGLEGERSKRDFDVINRAVKIKQQRVSVQTDLKETLKKRANRNDRIEEDKPWENEEYLLSPSPGKSRTLEDSFGDSDLMQGRRGARSMGSEISSLKKSLATLSIDSDGLNYLETDNSVVSNAATLATFNKQIETQREENQDLNKSLGKAVDKITSLSDDLRRHESESNKAKLVLGDVRREMSSLFEQNSRLHRSLDAVEKDLSTKEDKIDCLEQAVEENLDRVGFLEEKLESTEAELFKMEDEIKDLESNVPVENPDIKSRGRLERVNSIRMESAERMESKKNILARADSVRDMANNTIDEESQNKKASELSSWERKLEERERQLDLNRERDESSVQRLKEWEQRLSEKDQLLRDKSRDDYEEFARPQDVAEGQRLMKLSDAKQKQGSLAFEVSKDENTIQSSENEKDDLITDLKAECADLISEKEEIVRLHDEEEKQREEDLKIIQQDINERLRKLDEENNQLRKDLGAAEENIEKVKEHQKTIRKLETEVSILKKASTAVTGQEGMLLALQNEQLSELDEENRRIGEQLVLEQTTSQKKLKEREEVHIIELEEMLEELENNQEAEAQQRNNTLSRELSDAIETVEEKQNNIKELQKKLARITDDFEERNAQELLVKDAKIRQIEDELTATRAVIEAKTSDQLSMQMKSEIKTLQEAVTDLKRRIKEQQQEATSLLKQKEGTLKVVQREVAELRREVERKEKRERQSSEAKKSDITPEGDMKEHIEELIEEVEHWKAVNFELEDELIRTRMEDPEDQDFDENASLGSPTSQQSKQSLSQSKPSLASPEGLSLSHNSLSSLSKDDLFFVNDNNGSGTVPPLSPSGSGSQGAMRTVTGLWSKMTTRQPPTPTTGLYRLDD